MKKSLKLILILVFFIAVSFSLTAYKLYEIVFEPNITSNDYIYIPTGSDYDEIIDIFKTKHILLNINNFNILAKFKKYDTHIKSGKYRVTKKMSNNELINILRSGKQDVVHLTFNSIRTKKQLAARISMQIEADSNSIFRLLNDSSILAKYHFNTENSLLMFLPNTYNVYWNTTVTELFERMNHEYKTFWNEKRKEKAKNSGLTEIQIGILASIVQMETNKADEMSTIAGVYINRLKRDIPLQADPTVVYAVGDFSIRRVLNYHLEFDSPYNTYKYKGLPPGPICLPNTATIDRILDYEKHNYIYFCAKDDFSGYHNFASNQNQHINFAKKYHQALQKRNINK